MPGPFAEAEQRRLTELRTTAIEERAELLLAQGQAAAAVPELTALAAAHPLREQATGLLMIALYRCGRQAEALRVFGATRKRLAEDLGIDPSGELTRIHRQLLAMDPALDGPVTAPAAAIGAVAGDPGSGPASASDAAGAASAAPARPTAQQASSRAQPRPAAAGGGRLRGPDRRTPLAARAAGRLRGPPGAAAGPAQAAAAAESADAPGHPAVSLVALITGTAGVGKTTLAIRFAREAASRFPDGQLYVNLRGFDPASAPVPPGTALQGFFDALGVPPRHVQAGLDAQSALLRTLLDGKRMLLLLDNAHDADQVRPLLPGSVGCLVLVTSRSQLTGLVVADGARLLPLGVLDGGEATSLLVGRLGPGG